MPQGCRRCSVICCYFIHSVWQTVNPNPHSKLLIRVHILLIHARAQNSLDNFHSYPPNDHHCSDAVCWRRECMLDLMNTKHTLTYQLNNEVLWLYSKNNNQSPTDNHSNNHLLSLISISFSAYLLHQQISKSKCLIQILHHLNIY